MELSSLKYKFSCSRYRLPVGEMLGTRKVHKNFMCGRFFLLILLYAEIEVFLQFQERTYDQHKWEIRFY